MKLILSFLSSGFFYMTKKSWQNLNILRTKRAFRMKSKAFFIIFRGLSMMQITDIFFGFNKIKLFFLSFFFFWNSLFKGKVTVLGHVKTCNWLKHRKYQYIFILLLFLISNKLQLLFSSLCYCHFAGLWLTVNSTRIQLIPSRLRSLFKIFEKLGKRFQSKSQSLKNWLAFHHFLSIWL